MRMVMRALLACMLAIAAGGSASAANPVDDLLALVPPESGITLVVEDLRGQSKAFFSSPLAAGLAELPAVKAWMKSSKSSDLLKARKDIESVLGIDLNALRDDVLGDGVVLALIPPAEEPRGLLLTRFRDRKLLDQLISRINFVETSSRALVEVREHRGQGGGRTYWQRRFAAGTKPDEWYAIIEPSTFAWSNSEAVIQGVIARDKKSAAAGLASLGPFREVRDSLPESAFVRVFVDPKFLSQVAGPTLRNAADPVTISLKNALGSVAYLGASIQWRDGIILDVHARLNLPRTDATRQARIARQGGDPDPLATANATTLLAIAGRLDAVAVVDHLFKVASIEQRDKAQLGWNVLNGLFLGKDLRNDILPQVGPGMLLRVDAPVARDDMFPMVMTVDIGGGAAISAAIENALKTVWALAALDNQHGPIKVVSREISGVRVSSLSGTERPWSFAMTAGRLAIGSDAEAVASSLVKANSQAAKVPLARLREEFFPDSTNFAVVDLESLYRVVDVRRDLLAQRFARGRGRTEAEARRDLDSSLDLMRLFRVAYVTIGGKADASSAHLTAGLIARRAAR